MNDLKIIRRILVFVTIVLILYLLKILSTIFIPLISAIFLALLFMPTMRWLNKKRVPKWAAVGIATLIMVTVLFGSFQLVRLSFRQIAQNKEVFWEKADSRLQALRGPISELLDIELSPQEDHRMARDLLQSQKVSDWIYENFGSTLGFAQRLLVNSLMVVFFLILLLSESLNVQQLFGTLIFNRRNSSVRAFRALETSVVKFIQVKSFTSLLTGLGFGLTCYFFGVSFALFWGLIAFAFNYVQMIGSVVVTVFLILFAFVELTAPGSLLGFALILVGLQVLFGGVLEPILMGQSFSINTITVLVMLMLWGYIWGAAGLILSIPITVMLKIILEQFETTKVFVKVMS